ncbi:MAG TPA: class I SAM-dependent methyltransferase [Burkholderiales bacterium]|nr:class I SAM-dependent methyltransferase [Burkholderiales bacterium]
MVKVSLNSLPQTLLLPLKTRATFSKESQTVFYDKKAIELVEKLEYDFKNVIQAYGSTNLWWIARAYQTDQLIKDYLTKYPEAVIIDLGAGLETAFYRNDNGKLTWVDIDFPEVIDLRNKLLPISNRVHSYGKSILDDSWIEDVKKLGKHFLFISNGVFMYFKENEVKEILNKLNENFPDGKIVFDFISKKGLKYANQQMETAKILDAKIAWDVDNIKEILNILPTGVKANKKAYFKNFKSKLNVSIYSKLKLWFYDVFDQSGLAEITFSKN